MSRHAPSVLKPVPKQFTPPREPVRPTARAAQVLRTPRASGLQLSFQFHRLP
ncbi:MAG TPA: hypothetical protein VMT83_04630 [Burkholderiaceae bacterium]|nr:hypothetical protein [Burkholderiaceae bacterium]